MNRVPRSRVIVVAFPTLFEAKGLIRALRGRFRWIQGEGVLQGSIGEALFQRKKSEKEKESGIIRLILLITGIGEEHTTQRLKAALKCEAAVDLILLAGFAGALRDGWRKGDIAVADTPTARRLLGGEQVELRHPAENVSSSAGSFPSRLFQKIPNHEPRTTNHDDHPALVPGPASDLHPQAQKYHKPIGQRAGLPFAHESIALPEFRFARFCTAKKTLFTAREKAELAEATGAECVDMELAAAQAVVDTLTAQKSAGARGVADAQEIMAAQEIPLLCIRAISDLAHEDLPPALKYGYDLHRAQPTPGRLAGYLIKPSHWNEWLPFTRFLTSIRRPRHNLTCLLVSILKSVKT